MLKKNCHQVLGSQKSKLTPLELVFQTAGAINPPPYKDRVKYYVTLKCLYISQLLPSDTGKMPILL